MKKTAQRKLNRWAAAALLCVLLVLLMPAQALAAGSIDTGKDVGLTISYKDGTTPLANVRFSLYKVASVDTGGGLHVTGAFDSYGVTVSGDPDTWPALASTLEGYVLQDSIPAADSGLTSSHGQLGFSSSGGGALTQGLYLVLGERHTQGGYRYTPTPFMVMLPSNVGGDWKYYVITSPKFEKDSIPTGPVTVTRKVLKVWDDEGSEGNRPQEITVHLLRDGAEYQSVKLNASNNWRYTWTGLSSGYQWNVTEEKVDGYQVQITQEGITFVVKNKFTGTTSGEEKDPDDEPGKEDPGKDDPDSGKDDPDHGNGGSGNNGEGSGNGGGNSGQEKLPQTGQYWWPVPVLTVAGLLCICLGLLRRRGENHDE